MLKNLVTAMTGHKAGVLIGGFAIMLAMSVTLFLIFTVGGRDASLQQAYLTSRYNVSTPSELESKLAGLGGISTSNRAVLKDLDMPDFNKTKVSFDSIDLFDRVFTRQELCLAQAVYFEARGEPLLGQVAIAEVVLNRIASKRYPNTACKVVFQNQHMKNRCQFSFACDGKTDRPRDIKSWEQALKVVSLVLSGERSGVARQATHYHASYVAPRWRKHLDKVGEVGRHIFYRSGLI
ncbi:cell wall hydrolase [Sneathiella limimaris]|uniref:cell wall hydrolase n=1 Tax=Sneathiella limimaris TaxID=1964213 RepID=UPI00146F526C|nr:cell wall hydrolase [Sneathiella limimaris]